MCPKSGIHHFRGLKFGRVGTFPGLPYYCTTIFNCSHMTDTSNTFCQLPAKKVNRKANKNLKVPDWQENKWLMPSGGGSSWEAPWVGDRAQGDKGVHNRDHTGWGRYVGMHRDA